MLYLMRIFFIAFLFGLVLGLAALAHDGVHDQWFESLRSPATGIRCCSLDDCKPTEAEIRDGNWWAKTPDGVWHAIPKERVINDKGNPVGEPILCAVTTGDGYHILCFVPGALI